MSKLKTLNCTLIMLSSVMYNYLWYVLSLHKIIIKKLKNRLIGKDPDLGKIEGRRRRGCQRMRWLDGIYQFNGHEFEQALGDDGQGSLVCCSPWGCKESDTTGCLNNNKIIWASQMAQ